MLQDYYWDLWIYLGQAIMNGGVLLHFILFLFIIFTFVSGMLYQSWLTRNDTKRVKLLFFQLLHEFLDIIEPALDEEQKNNIGTQLLNKIKEEKYVAIHPNTLP